MDKQLMLLDDGKFYIERNCNGEAATTNGLLFRRYPISPTTPGGYECVGGYERCTAGEWGAWINVPYDEATDRDCRD
ncbi:hypothetical protein [Mycetohabitans sp. B8]|uniref:hypothetical protein n=1 Tax=Mycetohabitans sp. B8 TaxID=2841845 RepID=UPI001F2DCC50|nr:hypothetical protein [Mycetohabitans sp. B8]